MMAVRRWLALTALTFTAAGVGLANPAGAAPADLTRIDPQLTAQLAAAAPDTELMVFVHGSDLATAKAALADRGLQLVSTWDRISVAIASGTPDEIRTLVGAPGITYLEGNSELDYLLDTAHKATRADLARAETDTAGLEVDGRGVSVAVIDSGVDGTHPFFRLPDGTSKVVRNLKVLCHNLAPAPSADPTVADGCVADATDANDTDSGSAGGHGTHVAGIVGGVDTTLTKPAGKKVSGAAMGSRIVSLSVGASLSVYSANHALNWVVNHHDKPCGEAVSAAVCPPIRVTTNSYGPTGGGTFDPAGATAKLQRALITDGIVTVWAAGNDGEGKNTNPPGQDPTPGILMVANYNDGGTGTRTGSLNASSSRGVTATPSTFPDLSAPGTNINSSCRPTLTVCTAFGAAAGFSPEDGPGPGDIGTFNTISGTSMATPYIAGVVARLLQVNPALQPRDIENILEDTAHKFTAGDAYTTDPLNADHATSRDKGHGLVDVLAAVRLGRGYTPAVVPSLDRCIKPAVATDPVGDAVVPGPGGAAGAPSDTVDLVEVDFTFTADEIIPVMTVANLSALGTPGLGYAQYTTVWTSSDGLDYGAQMTLPAQEGAFYSARYGRWDRATNAFLSAPAAVFTNGQAVYGANGTLTIPVPRSYVGSPVLPVNTDTSPAGAPGVRDPYAIVLGGEGAFGTGLTFSAPADRAPDSNAGTPWLLCTTAEIAVAAAVVPEVPWTAVLPIIAILGMGGYIVRRRRLAPAEPW